MDDGERQYEWEAGRRLKKVIIKDDSASGIKDAYDAESDTRFSLEFTNGNLLANGVTSTIVRAHVYCRGQEVTEQYASYPLMWRRDTGDAAADDAWWRSKGRGWEITLTEADMGTGSKTKISCTLSGIMVFFGSVEVDENYQAIHTWAYTDENDRMHLENGILSVGQPNDGDPVRRGQPEGGVRLRRTGANHEPKGYEW